MGARDFDSATFATPAAEMTPILRACRRVVSLGAELSAEIGAEGTLAAILGAYVSCCHLSGVPANGVARVLRHHIDHIDEFYARLDLQAGRTRGNA